MDADFSIELGPDAAALELPWRDDEGGMQYVELRGATPIEQCIEAICEARDFPSMHRFLVAVNSELSAWQTAKCDLWYAACSPDENLYGAGCEHGSYVDFVLAQPFAQRRNELELHVDCARRLAQMLEEDENLQATAEIVVRRCYFHTKGDMEESDEGYCLTFFLTGYGSSAEEAAGRWEQGMDFAAHCWTRLGPAEESAQEEELG
jgi:hypothetical protein